MPASSGPPATATRSSRSAATLRPARRERREREHEPRQRLLGGRAAHAHADVGGVAEVLVGLRQARGASAGSLTPAAGVACATPSLDSGRAGPADARDERISAQLEGIPLGERDDLAGGHAQEADEEARGHRGEAEDEPPPQAGDAETQA